MALFKAVVWALIFLTKLRFPPGVSIAIVILIEHNKKDCTCSFYQNALWVEIVSKSKLKEDGLEMEEVIFFVL